MIQHRPKVSIGLPVYNGEQFLAEALSSLLAQTFTDFELIVSDNASDDRTEAICREYADTDCRIRYYRHDQNRGAAWNFNYVFGLATGEYFKWAAHDDICSSNFLERCVQVLNNDSSVVLCHSQTIFTKANGKKWWKGESVPNLDSWKPHERYEAVLSDFWCLAVFGLMRTEVLKKTSLIAPYYGSDRLLLTQLSLMGRFHEIPEPLFFRRCHSAQSSRLSAPERARWIDPRNAQKPKFMRYRGSLGYFQAIFKAPLSWQERVSCLNVLARYLLHSGTWQKFFIKIKPHEVSS